MNEKTKEFLLACKEAGYERVTIFMEDKRVPCSVQIRKGSMGAYWGTGTIGSPFKVVCGAPERLGRHYAYAGETWPQMWSIVKRLELNEGGAGSRDGHDIAKSKLGLLTAGYYDLSELN